MNVPCPKCQVAFQVPDEVMTRGVAHVTCQKCSFKFVIRLGDPGNATRPEEPPPGAPLELGEGVKTSGAASSASGEIGAARPRFIAAQTSTSIRVDPGFAEEINQIAAGQTPLAARPTPLDPTPVQPAPAEPTPAEPLAAQPTATEPAERSTVEPPTEPGEPLAQTPTEVEPSPEGTVEPSPEGAPSPEGTAPVQTGSEAAPQPAAVQQPAALASTSDGFEAFHAINAPVIPPPGADVPAAPVMATHQVMHPAYQHPLVMVITPQDPDAWNTTQLEPSPNRGMRALGLFMTLVLSVAALLFFFILYRNDWSLDLANFDKIMGRAFGTESPRSNVPDELRGLQVDQPTSPIVEQAKLSDGQPVLTIQGVVRNNDTRTRRFVYVRATLKDIHNRTVTSIETPAGNVFTVEQLASMTRSRLASSINPAGRDGSNARLEPGQSVAYMVVVTTVPHDYDPTRYSVVAEVSQAELYEGP